MTEKEEFDKSDLIKKYEEMVGQEKSYYFDADQIEAVAGWYELKEDFNEALNAVKYGLTLHPSSETLLLYKAKYLLFLDYTEEAKKIMDHLPLENEEAELVRIELSFAENNSEKAFSLIQKKLESDEMTWEFCMDVISILWGYGTFTEIIDFVLASLKKLPDNQELLNELGMLYQDNLMIDEAIDVFNRILDKDPFHENSWESLAKAYVIKREFEKAIEACDFALAINEKNADVLLLRGFCQYDADDAQGALATFTQYYDLTNDKLRGLELMAECHSKLGNMKQSFDLLNQSLEIDSSNSYTYYLIALNYLDMGNTPMAREYVNKALALNDGDSQYHLLLCDLYMCEENWEKGLDAAKKLYELDPLSPNILPKLGELYTKLEDYASAVHYYELALKEDPDNLGVKFSLVASYHLNEENEKAAQLTDNLFRTANTDKESENSNISRDVLQRFHNLMTEITLSLVDPEKFNKKSAEEPGQD